MAMTQEQLDAFISRIGTLPTDKKVKLFIKTREAKAAATRAADLEAAQFKAIMTACENMMLAEADSVGVSGFKTDFGTTFIAETKQISIADDTAFFAFVKETGDLDFFERRVSSRHVDEWLKTNPTPPPGLNIFRERVMRVRKAGEK